MKIHLDEFCTRLIIIFSTIMLAFTEYLDINKTKYCLYAIVALSFIKILWMNFKQSVAALLVIISFLIIYFAHGGIVANFLIFFTSLLFASSVFYNGIQYKTWQLVKVCTYVVCVSFIYQNVTHSSYSIYGQLMLGFDNPNMTGIALCAPTIMLILMLSQKSSKLSKLFNIILLIYMLQMIYATQNRSSIISLFAIMLVYFLATRSKKSIRINKNWMYKFLALMPVIVMFIYVGMYMLLPKEIEFLGKPLFSGREQAWMQALTKLSSNPFAYYQYDGGTLNLFLEGATRYGTLAMVSYFAMLLSFKKDNIDKLPVFNYVAYAAFFFCLFQQSFESTMITGSYGIYVWNYILLGIASMKPTDLELDMSQNNEAPIPIGNEE